MNYFDQMPMSGAMPPQQEYGSEQYQSPYDVGGDYNPFDPVDLFGAEYMGYQMPQPAPYQDPYSSYQMPQPAPYQDPYSSYENPYAQYEDPFSDIDVFSADRFQPITPPAPNPYMYMQPDMPVEQQGSMNMTPPIESQPSTGIATINQRNQPVEAPTFFAGDREFDSRQAALNYARNELKDPDAVEFVRAGQTREPQMTAEEKRLAEERRLEGLRRFEENRRRVDEFKARKQALIDQYSGRNVEGGYGLEARGFENVRFSNLEEAMAALRELNAGGTDPNNLAVSYDKLVNMGAGPMFAVSQGVNQNRLDMPRFSNREDAINYLMRERGFDRARAERNVRQKG